MMLLCRCSSVRCLLLWCAATPLAALLADTAVEFWAVLLANGLSTMLCFLRAWFWSAFTCCHVNTPLCNLIPLFTVFLEERCTHRGSLIQRNLPGLSQDVCQSGCFVQTNIDYFPRNPPEIR